MSDDLEIRSEMWERGMVRIDISGLLNATNLDEIDREFARWFSLDAYSFALGLTELAQLSNTGAALLISLVRMAQEKGGRVVLVEASEPVKRTLRRFGVLDLFHSVDSFHELVG